MNFACLYNKCQIRTFIKEAFFKNQLYVYTIIILLQKDSETKSVKTLYR